MSLSLPQSNTGVRLPFTVANTHTRAISVHSEEENEFRERRVGFGFPQFDTKRKMGSEGSFFFFFCSRVLLLHDTYIFLYVSHYFFAPPLSAIREEGSLGAEPTRQQSNIEERWQLTLFARTLSLPLKTTTTTRQK